jgi:hypothetical protein
VASLRGGVTPIMPMILMGTVTLAVAGSGHRSS